MTRYLIIPGWGGSGPDHWQTHWERDLANAARVEMSDWLDPRRAAWIAAIDRAVGAHAEPPILIAHSLGCIAVAHWAEVMPREIRGALLVAPPDLDRDGGTKTLHEFAPVPRVRLPFPTRVVISIDDPYSTPQRAAQMAFFWGSALNLLRAAVHINSESGYGRWPQGRRLLASIVDEDPDRRSAGSNGASIMPIEVDDSLSATRWIEARRTWPAN